MKDTQEDADAMADRLLGVVFRAGTYLTWDSNKTLGNEYVWQILENYTGVEKSVVAMVIHPHQAPSQLHNLPSMRAVPVEELKERGIL